MKKVTKQLWKLTGKTFRLLDSPPQHELFPKTNPLAVHRTLLHPKKKAPLPLREQMQREFRNWNRVREK